MLEQFRISDFLEWNSSKSLKLNPDFQRGSVWTPTARIMLIDTILRDLPIPKIFIRSKIDTTTKRTIREIVDGQQRLRAIIDFSDDKITLSKRAKEFEGYKFSSLPLELQERFLSYPLAVDQLVNADDTTVLDIFARLNSYNVKLNAAELRHAGYQGDFKIAVHENAIRLLDFWENYHIFSKRDMVRMENDSLVAEMFITLTQGVSDGGAEKIDRAYKKYDSDGQFDRQEFERKFVDTMNLISSEIAPRLSNHAVLQPPHLLMLFASISHSLHGLPQGGLDGLPNRQPILPDANIVADRLSELSQVILAKEEPATLKEFWRASRSSTQRISSRKARFLPYYLAVTS
ncbi:DUF262 domain-containing protein [Novosphingobium sp.]|uniref:DUF262 domain-containing protein n=1 Tax=Novosphingobium sp. TaxID=1874826 RepID=UPI0038BC1FC2